MSRTYITLSGGLSVVNAWFESTAEPIADQ